MKDHAPMRHAISKAVQQAHGSIPINVIKAMKKI